MRMSWLQRRFVLDHSRGYSNAQLAKAIGASKQEIAELLRKEKVVRTADEVRMIRERETVEGPVYTGFIPEPLDSRKLDRRDFAVAVGVALIAFIIYLMTLGSTVTGEDSGELVTAAYTMGIAHPPGYPLWCILGKAFTFIPIGSIAWRVALMSAVLATGTVFIVCLLAIKLTRSRIAAASAALLFAFSRELWEQSVIAEVYSLNALLIACCLFALLCWYERRERKSLFCLAMAFGLGATNHHTMPFLAPVFACLLLAMDREPWRRWRLYSTALMIAVACQAIYLYLPLRSLANPPMDWGNPETLDNFVDMVTRAQYKLDNTKPGPSLSRAIIQIGVFCKSYAFEFTPWLCWLPIAGAVVAIRRNAIARWALLPLFLWLSLGLTVIVNFDYDKQSQWLVNAFNIPAYLVAALFSAWFIAWVCKLRFRWATAAAYALAINMVVFPFAANYRFVDKSDYKFARDYGVNILNTLDPDAVYFPNADHATFPIIYLHYVEGMRPDITIANKYGYPEESVYADMPEADRANFHKVPTKDEERLMEDWVLHHTEQPVYFTQKRDLPDGKRMVNAGLLYRVVNEQETPPDRDYWSEYKWRTLDPADTHGELSADYILGDYYFALGRTQLDKDAPEAIETMERALNTGGRTRENLNNVGSALADSGKLEQSKSYFSQAADSDPKYDTALRNLGKACLQLGQPAEALEAFKRVLLIEAGDAEAHWMIVRCFKELGRPGEAIQLLHKMAQAQPRDAAVYRELGFLYLNDEKNPYMARQMFSQSLSLNPEQPDLARVLTNLDTGPARPDKTPASLPGMPKLPELPGMDAQSNMLDDIPLPNAPAGGAPSPNPMAPGGSIPGMPVLPGIPGQ